jgi:hypothetical protein
MFQLPAALVSPLRSGRRPATVDRHHCSVDERRLIRAQIKHEPRDLVRLAQPAHRLPLVQLGPDLLFFVAVILFEVALHEGSIDCSWRNTIHADLSGIVDSQLTGHRDHRALRSAIREPFLHPY